MVSMVENEARIVMKKGAPRDDQGEDDGVYVSLGAPMKSRKSELLIRR